ncbi:hypothetical protein Tco_1428138 [Tanacetum coccineum]
MVSIRVVPPILRVEETRLLVRRIWCILPQTFASTVESCFLFSSPHSKHFLLQVAQKVSNRFEIPLVESEEDPTSPQEILQENLEHWYILKSLLLRLGLFNASLCCEHVAHRIIGICGHPFSRDRDVLLGHYAMIAWRFNEHTDRRGELVAVLGALIREFESPRMASSPPVPPFSQYTAVICHSPVVAVCLVLLIGPLGGSRALIAYQNIVHGSCRVYIRLTLPFAQSCQDLASGKHSNTQQWRLLGASSDEKTCNLDFLRTE